MKFSCLLLLLFFVEFLPTQSFRPFLIQRQNTPNQYSYVDVNQASVFFSKANSRIQRHLLDPATSVTDVGSSLNDLAQQPEIFASGLLDGFSHTFSSRLIGVLAGNVVAIFLLKIITDWIWQSARNKYADVVDSITKPFRSTPREMKSKSKSDQSIVAAGKEVESDVDTPLPPSAYLTLVLCILIDFGGDASFLLPGIGEAEDAAWAPLSAFLLSNIFGSNVVTTLDFVKEALPGTDVIPMAVIAWLLKNKYPDSSAARYLGLSRENKNNKNKQ